MSDINLSASNQTITIINNLTGNVLSDTDFIFTIPASSITVSCEGSFNGKSIYKIFDREILWDFGDGTTVLGKSATHYYDKPGYYKVTCVFFDEEGNAYPNTKTDRQYVKVVDIFQTTINFTKDFIEEHKNEISTFAGQKTKVAEFISTLDKIIDKEVPIKCYASHYNSPNIFELNYNDSFEFLMPYSAFYNDEDDDPRLSIVPKYKNVYCTFTYLEDKRVKINLYVLEGEEDEIKKYNDLVLFNDFNKDALGSWEAYYNVTVMLPQYEFIAINSLSEIPTEEYYFTGKIGLAEIYFKDDLPSKNNEKDSLVFVLDQDYFPDENILLSKNSINLVSLGSELTINPNTTENLQVLLSTSGLFQKRDLDNTESVVTNNVYSYHIAKYIGVGSPFVVRLAKWNEEQNEYYFIKDLKIDSWEWLINDEKLKDYVKTEFFEKKAPDGEYYKNYGSLFGEIIPIKEGSMEDDDIDIMGWSFRIFVNGLPKYTEPFYFDLIDFNSFSDSKSRFYLNPKQKEEPYSAYEWWETYKTHPVFENVPFLDEFMMALFENKDLLQKLLNKGDNFVDDIANIDTCSIKNLLSILNSIDFEVNLYNGENFSKPLSVSELIRILSINHSKLIGHKELIQDEFITHNGFKGKNLGDQIDIDEKIYINKTNTDKFIWPKIVVYDKFAKKYFLVNVALLEKIKDNPLKTDGKGTYFIISEYQQSWGWNLLLTNEEIKGYDNNNNNNNNNPIIEYKNVIDKFYEFYYYVETTETEVIDSYLDPDTISNRVKDYETWTKFDGSIDRLLYKIIIEELNLLN